MQTGPRISIVHATLASLAAGLLAGCSASLIPNPVQEDRVPVGRIEGSFHGGQQPVAGASIYLYASGSTAQGSDATSLLSSASNTYEDGNGNYYVTTDADGNFSISGDYTCTAGTQVYMMAVGADPGELKAPLRPPNAATANNSATVQMAALGLCPATGNLASQVPYLLINQGATVASAVPAIARTPSQPLLRPAD